MIIISKVLKNWDRKLLDKEVLKNFYNEALFNNNEVKFLTIKDNRIKDRNVFKIFTKDDVLNILAADNDGMISRLEFTNLMSTSSIKNNASKSKKFSTR